MKENSNIIFDEDLIIAKKIKKIIKKNNFKPLSIGYANSNLKIIDHKFIGVDQYVKFLYKNNIYKFSTNLIGKIQIKNLLMSIFMAI